MGLHKVLEMTFLKRHAYRLRVERGSIEFKAGQCVTVGVPGAGVSREYTVYSGEKEPWIDLLILEAENGIVSAGLKTLRPGGSADLHGAYGGFRLRETNAGRPHLFVGTGTGIAPFHSFVRTRPALDYKILHGVRYADEAYDRGDYDGARFVSCVSREEGGDFRGRVTDHLRAHPPAKETVCYLCGNRSMIVDAYDVLRAQGIPGDAIFTEVFF